MNTHDTDAESNADKRLDEAFHRGFAVGPDNDLGPELRALVQENMAKFRRSSRARLRERLNEVRCRVFGREKDADAES
ncbi:MAG: hypothetical protein WD645_03165 [Dehalococcoidia bacterium]